MSGLSLIFILFLAGERLRQRYGQQDARHFLKRTLKLRRDDLRTPHSAPISLILNLCMTILCFGAPYSYLRHINEFRIVGPGRTDTITERWQVFVDDNVTDWTNTNLVVRFFLGWWASEPLLSTCHLYQATVLVSASVALLAIPGIDTTTRMLGIFSTLYSIASIIVGLLNVWQHQHKSRSGLELTVIVRRPLYILGYSMTLSNHFLVWLLWQCRTDSQKRWASSHPSITSDDLAYMVNTHVCRVYGDVFLVRD